MGTVAAAPAHVVPAVPGTSRWLSAPVPRTRFPIDDGMLRSRSQLPLEPDSDSEQEDISVNFAGESDASEGDQDVEDWEEEEEEEERDVRDEDMEPGSGSGSATTASPQIPADNLLSRIKNKLRRRQAYEKQEAEKRAALKKQKKRGVREEKEKRPTRTIDNACGFAETLPDEPSQADDPFTCYFNKEREPKLLMTTVDHPRVKTIRFCQEFARTIPNMEFKFRKNCSVKGTMKAAHERGYTHLLVVNQDGRKPNGILMIHLPDGPTANFKLSSVKYHKEIRHSGVHSSERPEIIVNNFHTRLGQTIGRLFVSLCHFDPEFKGRRVVTFHNQRDYIFFRHHRYQFKNKKRVALQEIGPRFTLRLRWYQKGPFDTKSEQFDFVSKREEKDSSGRRLFFL